MGKPHVPLDPVADLRRRLVRLGRLKPLARIRTCVLAWWDEHGLGDHPATVAKRIALALIEQPKTEHKLAGILILEELVGDQLRAGDLPSFAALFQRGHLADWNVVDSFCTNVLATLLERMPGRAEAARTIAQWRGADTVWQRRAACISFTRLAPRGDGALPGLTELILTVCATVVWSHLHFDQTAVGGVLRELSRAEPGRVEAFFRRYARLMSKECARHAVARFPVAQRAILLAHHKRATSLRR